MSLAARLAGGWVALDVPPDLLEDDVHVWKAPLRVGEERLAQLHAHLSAAEIERTDRLKIAFRRHEAVVSRGTLREVLSGYLALGPGEIEFSYLPQGKPELVGMPAGVQFNVAHAHEWLLVAVALDRPVGVDVEKVRADIAFEQMASRYFSEPERDALFALPDDRRADGFFRAWTLKEALLKAYATGFGLRLADFDVTVDPAEPPALVAARDTAFGAIDWRLADLDPAPGYRAAVAVPGRAPVVSCLVANAVPRQ